LPFWGSRPSCPPRPLEHQRHSCEAGGAENGGTLAIPKRRF
jgi:hypothetical protein